MAYNPKSLDNLIPFTGVEDKRRCNGRPKGALNKITRIRNALYGAQTEERPPTSELVDFAVSEALNGSTPAATALVEIMIGDFGTTKVKDLIFPVNRPSLTPKNVRTGPPCRF